MPIETIEQVASTTFYAVSGLDWGTVMDIFASSTPLVLGGMIMALGEALFAPILVMSGLFIVFGLAVRGYNKYYK